MSNLATAIDKKQEHRAEFERFSPAFESNLVKLIVQDRAFASQMQEVLELNYFKEVHHQMMVEQIFKYKDKFGCQPAFDTIDLLFTHELSKTVDEINKRNINHLWTNIKKAPKVEDAEYYMVTALNFCRSKKLINSVKENGQLLLDANIDGFMEAITKAASLGSSNNFGHDYKEDFEKRYEKDHRDPITTGFPILDAKSGGGIGRGEVFVYVAPQSQGKTSHMIYTAVQNLRAGRNVVFFTLEMKEAIIGQMFDICLTEIRRDEFMVDIENSKKSVKERLDELPGKLRIIQEEYGISTPRRMINKVKKLEDSGFSVDLVCVDYMDICAPTKAMRDDDGMVGGVQAYSELKTLTERYNLRMLTAAQTNREGAEANIITPKHFEGMFKRFNPCHLVIGFSKFNKVSCLKTRVGPQFLLNEEKDFARLQFDIFEADVDNVHDHTPQSMSDALDAFMKKRGKR